MKILVEITTTSGEFTFERDLTVPSETGGFLGAFGQKIVASDAAITEARQVLDVLPTIITAINSEFAAVAAQPTLAEIRAVKDRVKNAEANMMNIIVAGVEAKHERVKIARDVREWCRVEGVEWPSLKKVVELITAEQTRHDAERITAAVSPQE